jgi:hypothetical protein
MNRMMRNAIWILIAALLFAGISVVNANASLIPEACVPGDSSGAQPYWYYYQYSSIPDCGTAVNQPAQLYWSYYQFPPRTDFTLAQRPSLYWSYYQFPPRFDFTLAQRP